MTIQELHESPLYKILDEREKKWVDIYCKTGDPKEATKSVFNTVTAQAITSMTRKMMTEPRVVAVTSLWNGQLIEEPSLDEYRHELWRMAKECKSDAARAALMRLYGEARGFIKKSRIEAADPKPDADVLKEIEMA